MTMEIKNFFQNKLSELSRRFFVVSLAYVYDPVYNQHIIEINPEASYLSEEFAQAQIKLELEFIEKFPEEEIMFISGEHGLQLPSFDFVIKPILKYQDIVEVIEVFSKIFTEVVSFNKEVLASYNSDCLPPGFNISQLETLERMTETKIRITTSGHIDNSYAMAA